MTDTRPHRVPQRAEVEALMKRCQIGVGGRHALDDAHSIMADCYGTLGLLMLCLTESDRLLTDLQALHRGRIAHVFLGDCPDERQPTERDQSCPACQVLLRLDAWRVSPGQPVRP